MNENVFCGSCGNKLTTDDQFCGSCGAKNLNYVDNDSVENNSIENNAIENNPVENNVIENNAIENNSIENNATPNPNIISNVTITETGVEQNNYVSENTLPKANKNTTIGIIVSALVLIIVGGFVYHFSFGSGNAEAVANKYMKVYLTYDGEDLLELVHEDILSSYLNEKQTRSSDFENSVSDYARYNVDRIAARINASTRNISKSTEIVDYFETTIGVRDVDDIIDKYEDYFDSDKIKDVINFQFELKFEGEDKDIYADHSVNLIKIGTNWYWDFISHDYALDF